MSYISNSEPVASVPFDSDNSCHAVTNGFGSQGVIATARCCSFTSIESIESNEPDINVIESNIEFNCSTVWGTRSAANDDTLSAADCSSLSSKNAFLSDCGGLDAVGKFDGMWFFNSNVNSVDTGAGTCYAQNGWAGENDDDSDDSDDNGAAGCGGGDCIDGAIAQALCCEAKIVTKTTHMTQMTPTTTTQSTTQVLDAPDGPLEELFGSTKTQRQDILLFKTIVNQINLWNQNCN